MNLKQITAISAAIISVFAALTTLGSYVVFKGEFDRSINNVRMIHHLNSLKTLSSLLAETLDELSKTDISGPTGKVKYRDGLTDCARM